MTREQKFLNALRDVFVGAKVEGESGYINLMRIKSRYYEIGVFPRLQQDIHEALKPFPGFREELFEKLYDFFHRYFSESGSIYFRYTPLHQNVYEKVYTDDKDVMLFWKTHMLYYVKTDRLFKSLAVELDGQKFFFDVSSLEHKKANEKRDIVYSFKEKRKDTLVFEVAYSERGRITKVDDILRTLRRQGVMIKEDLLSRAFCIFEKQSEVDYFINKDAKAFLEEQFNLWLYQYVFSGMSSWTETRIRQLQTLKEIAFKIIAFISQFENELVKIWNKPKFVLNSNYVITLDRIAEKEGGLTLVEKLLAHRNFKAQVEEWQQLGIVDESFKKTEVLEKEGKGKRLAESYQHLPVDTKHFKDLELNILGLFDNLDQELDGWIIQSENYQALRTLLPKLRERVKCVHIDPPYNTDTSGFLYKNAYQHSSWLTMMDNRIRASLPLISSRGAFLCHIDENECERLQLLCTEIGMADGGGTVVWDKKNPMLGRKGVATQHEYVLWRTSLDSPIYLRSANVRRILEKAKALIQQYGGVNRQVRREFAAWISSCEGLSGGERAYRLIDNEGRVFQSVAMGAPEPRSDPKFHIPLVHPVTKKKCPVPSNGWSRAPETLKELIEKGEVIFGVDETVQPRLKVVLTKESKRQLPSVIGDASRGKQDLEKLGLEFPYCHPVSLYEELQGAGAPDSNDIVLDYFAGSGTTAHALINVNREDGGKRKYILVEMAQYRGTVILPRVKKVVFSDNWKDGKVEQGGQGIGHFCKYYELEQYEDALRRANYGDADLFNDPNRDPYHQYVFLRDLKMLEALEVDTRKNEVKVDQGKLYDGIDIAETLANLTGKWIKRITADSVEFDDGEVVDTKNLDWKRIKPLIWW